MVVNYMFNSYYLNLVYNIEENKPHLKFVKNIKNEEILFKLNFI